MAEGPSIVILKERASVFVGHEIVRVEGNTPIAKERPLGHRMVGLRSFGKHFLIEFPSMPNATISRSPGLPSMRPVCRWRAVQRDAAAAAVQTNSTKLTA